MAIGNAIGIGFGNLIVTIATIIQTFKARVLLDSGTFEAESYLLTQNANNIQSASFVYIPAAYKAGIDYSIKGGDLTHARNSVAYRNNASNVLEQMAANFGRVSYVGGVPTLLMEPLATNICLQSNNFTNVNWIKTFSATITANSATSPDGTNNASLLAVGTSAFSGIYYTISGSSNQYTTSIFAKKGTFNFLYFVDVTGTTTVAWFNLNNGTVGTVAIGYTARISESEYKNGWYLCEVSRTGANQAPSYFQIGASNNDNTNGGIGGNILIYKAQVETTKLATSRIDTTTAAVTRVADVATVTRTFTANSTVFQNVYLNAGSLSDGVQYTLLDARVSSTVRITLYRLNNNLAIDVINSTTQYSGTVWALPTLVQNTVYKIAIVTTATGFKVFVNGALRYTSGTLSMPTLTSATYAIGSFATGVLQYNGSIINNFVENTNLDDATCIARTT